MSKKLLKGTICANITPFKTDGSVDYSSMRKLVQYLVESGINGLFPNGTNGEGILLDLDERREIAELIISEVDKRIPVVIQCGAQTTDDTVALAVHAVSAGAAGIGVMTPYFFHQDDETLYRYYLTVAQAVPDLPVYIYNIPSHTNNDVQPKLAARIQAAAPNITGIKYSFSDMLRLGEYIRISNSFDVLIGCDRLMLAALSGGAVGAVSGPASIYPELFKKLWLAWNQNNLDLARQSQMRITDFDNGLATYAGIPLIKAYLKNIGVIDSTFCRSPFRHYTDDENHRMFLDIQQYKQNDK